MKIGPVKRNLDPKPTMPDPGYTEADLAEAADFPEMTSEQLAAARPFVEVLPELAGSIRRRGKQRAPTKVPVSIRLDPEVVEHFKAGGRGWQGRMGDALAEAVKRNPRADQD